MKWVTSWISTHTSKVRMDHHRLCPGAELTFRSQDTAIGKGQSPSSISPQQCDDLDGEPCRPRPRLVPCHSQLLEQAASLRKPDGRLPLWRRQQRLNSRITM
jgi:hypothetical protein